MGQVIILQGVSGAGKSTLVASYAGATVVSADHFFEVDGEYRFDASRLGAAHGACLRKFIEAVQGGAAVVVVDNTNTTVREVAPYYAAGEAYGYTVEIVWVRCDLRVAAQRNRHGVPAHVVEAMGRRLLEFDRQMPAQWDRKVVG